jgi:hypothetical protein
MQDGVSISHSKYRGLPDHTRESHSSLLQIHLDPICLVSS